MRRPLGLATDFRREELVVTFERLIADSPFIGRCTAALRAFHRAFGEPLRLSFAAESEERLCLTGCRPQRYWQGWRAGSLPDDADGEGVLFAADRYVTNGHLRALEYLVFVVPEAFAALTHPEELRQVARTVGQLNQRLPARKFALLGPGRWGCKGEVQLGVPVLFDEINRAAILIEIALIRDNYIPELSFGSHFYPDLIRAGIRYLPLYLGPQDDRFNHRFFREAPNCLSEIISVEEQLAATIKVIHLPRLADGRCLCVRMDGEQQRAVGLLSLATD
jgi:hypothetical protein